MVPRIRGRRRLVLAGLTGSFGTGKSTVARLFRKEGARILDTDRLAHEVFRKGNRMYSRIRSLFPEIKGILTRTKIARIVFQDSGRRQKLESLIHPYVFWRLREELERMRGGVIILEIPLLFETGFQRRCDVTIAVTASREKVLKRLARKGVSPEEVERRWRAQMPLAEKVRRADYAVNNSQGRTRTERRVKQIWKELRIKLQSL